MKAETAIDVNTNDINSYQFLIYQVLKDEAVPERSAKCL